MKHFFVTLALTLLVCSSCSHSYKVVVVGGGTGGVAAGIQAARMGAKTLIIEQTPWLGGMLTSAGVSATDGNHRLRAGLFGEFADSLALRYGGFDKLCTGWVSNMLFEPHVGADIFNNICSSQKGLKVQTNAQILSIKRTKKGWKITYSDSTGKSCSVVSQMLIDGTELGDVAASLGVPYEKDANIQDLTYVAILRDYGYPALAVPAPEGYNPDLYRSCGESWRVLSYGKLPTLDGSTKYMLNWPLAGNDTYIDVIEMTPAQRAQALDSAKNITLGFVHYLQNECGLINVGIAYDEYNTPDGLPYIPYYRESRRIVGEVRLDVEDIQNPYHSNLFRTSIAVGDYLLDHHHNRNFTFNLSEDLPPVPSFSVPMGVVIPKGVEGLLVVDKSISVSHDANGTTRLQPVVMQVGQAAGALAVLAIKAGGVRKVSVRQLQTVILSYGGYIMPYLDVPQTDSSFVSLQKIGATGIMRGSGKAVDWSNETYFRAFESALQEEIYLQDYYPNGAPACLSGHDSTHTRLQIAEQIDKQFHPFETFEVDLQGNIITTLNQKQ